MLFDKYFPLNPKEQEKALCLFSVQTLNPPTLQERFNTRTFQRVEINLPEQCTLIYPQY